MSGVTTATALTVASIAATVIGAGVSAYGQMQAGKAAQSAANYQAAVASNNKIIADRAAADALKRGETAESQHRQQVAALKGRQRAVMAGNGVVVDQGSALDITTDTAGQGEFEALTIRSNAEREAYNHKVQGMGFQADAGLLTMRGDSAAQAGMTGAASSLLSGAGAVAGKWYDMKKAGVGSGGFDSSSSYANYRGSGFGEDL